MVCAIVAMCTNQVERGLILLLSSFASLAMCGVIFVIAIFGTVFGAFGLAVHKAHLNTSPLSPSFGRVSQWIFPLEIFCLSNRKRNNVRLPPLRLLHSSSRIPANIAAAGKFRKKLYVCENRLGHSHPKDR